MFTRTKIKFCAFLIVILASACSQSERATLILKEPTFHKVNIKSLPGWRSDRTLKALPALIESCQAILKKRDREVGRTDKRLISYVAWAEVCERVPKKETSETNFRQYLKSNFNVFQLKTETGKPGLFTGYFEPVLKGSTKKSSKYNVPIYPKPKNLIKVNLRDWKEVKNKTHIVGRLDGDKLKPYFSRAEITAGALSEDVLPLVWLESEIEAFFLHIQGSGKIQLPDGSIYRVGYAGKNGHKYYPIGRYLHKVGAISKENLSLQSIRQWLNSNPNQINKILNMNPSFIFFRRVYGKGPIGAQSVPLTKGRSLAVDPRFVPLGAPVWVAADYADEENQTFNRLMIAQDTGGAIKGPVRGDVFWGSGKVAEKYAGTMKAPGYLYLFLPKTVDPE